MFLLINILFGLIWNQNNCSDVENEKILHLIEKLFWLPSQIVLKYKDTISIIFIYVRISQTSNVTKICNRNNLNTNVSQQRKAEMNSTTVARIEILKRENYDTWKMHMKVLLLTKNAVWWDYVNEKCEKPVFNNADENSEDAVSSWKKWMRINPSPIWFRQK